MFEIIERPQQKTGNTLYDYAEVLPPNAPIGKLFQIKDSHFLIQAYAGKGKMMGIHVYKPWYFEGTVNHHQKISLQPNGKVKRYSEHYKISGFTYG